MTYGAVAAMVAVAVPTYVVLRDVAAYDRPPVRVAPPVPVVAETSAEDSILASITVTEAEERSPVRRAIALGVLMVLTALTAAGVGVLVYRMVSGLG